MIRRASVFAVAAAALIVLAGCAGATTSPSPAPTPSLSASATPPSASPASAAPSSPAESSSSAAEPSASAAAPSGPKGTVILMTHDSFALADSVIAAFTQQSGYGLQVLHSGDAGAMVNQAILSKGHPLGDVLFGVDNTFLSRALNAGIFDPYQSPAASGVDPKLDLDPQHRVTPIDYGDVCPVFDDSRFVNAQRLSQSTPAASLAAPTSLDDLATAPYSGMLVTENPATSSPGLAFMLATIAKYGEGTSGGWLDYWSKLRANDVLVSQSWDDAYDSRFSAGPGGGDRPIVISYATDPAADVVFADPPKDKPSVSVMLDACFRQVEFAGVLAGTSNPDGARAFIDFLLSAPAQEDIPSEMYVFPAVTGTTLPDAFKQWAQIAPDPLTVDPAQIEQKREQWINEWTDTVVR
jgi:thiamine transport system substrate-binding protein